MKKQILLMILATILAFTSCKKDNVNFVFPTGNIRIILPENANITARNNQTVKFTNRTTNEVKTVSYGDEVELTKGLYDCDYTAEVEYIVDGVTCNAMLSGSVSSVNIIDETGFPITTYLMVSCNDFIIEEIFFTGTLRPSGTTYNGDSYIKLYNNTDKVLYADGVAIFDSLVQYYDYSKRMQLVRPRYNRRLCRRFPH